MALSKIQKAIRKIGEELPKGGINRVTEISGFSQSYVSQFFAGKYNLSDSNKKILDAVRQFNSELKQKENEQLIEIESLTKK